MAVCEKAKASVEADDEAGTLTFNLAQPWGPWLATLAQSWGAAMDKEWAIENGAWDGTCETWVDHYSPGAENTPLGSVINGTGPYKLDYWTPGRGVGPDRQRGLLAGRRATRCGPAAPAACPGSSASFSKLVDEWGTRFAMLQAGDAENVAVPAANRPQVDEFVGEVCDYETNECTPTDNPDAPLRKWGNLPSVSRTNVFMNFDLSQEEGTNPYIGSGQLDGNGIPPDFFNDIHVRKALNYCFDYDTFIADAQNGEGIRNNGPIIYGMLGYNEDGPMYEYDLEKCEAELAAGLGRRAARDRLPLSRWPTTPATSLARQPAPSCSPALRTINENYQIECLGLPWPTMLRSFRAGQLPLTASGWIEDIHDPHNWVQPFTVGTYAGRQNLDPDLKAQFQEWSPLA